MHYLAIGALSLLLSVPPIIARAQSPAQADGAELYHDYCSVCHGDRGDGNSRARGSFSPPPRDFTSPIAVSELTRDRMIFAVTYGVSDTAMSGWGTRLGEEQIASVVDYVRRKFMAIDEHDQDAGHAGGHDAHTKHLAEAADPEYMNQQMPRNLIGDAEQGREFFNHNCAVCHGVRGDGRGPRAFFILPKPRNFRHPAARNHLNRPHLFEDIAAGSAGTEMPAWDKVLDDQQIANVAEYVFQAFILPRPD